MKWKLILGEAIALALLVVAYVLVRPGAGSAAGEGREGEPLVRNLPVERISAIEIAKGGEQVVLRKQGGTEEGQTEESWVVENAWDCQANNKKIKEFVDEVRTLKRGHFRGESDKMLKEYGLDEKERTTVRFKDAKGNELALLVLGKMTYSLRDMTSAQQGKTVETTSTTFVMLPGTSIVHEIAGNHSAQAARTAWADLQLLDFTSDQVVALQVYVGAEQYALVRKARESNGKEEKKEGTEGENMEKEFEWFLHKERGTDPVRADDSKVNSYVLTLSRFSATDVVEPMKIMAGMQEPSAEEKARYGFDKPALAVCIGFPHEVTG
ncbi:MAG: DUF4340 domain-containing protein, partial [Planctomycetota bacterium]|nr:DUF4340 domain-containing protein [Planctomycetota bacterium]